MFPSLYTHTCPVEEATEITSCAGSGDSHRMALQCLKAADFESWGMSLKAGFFPSNYLIQERWRISKPNYRVSFLKLFKRWSFTWLHCFCSVLFSLFITILRLKLNLTSTKIFLFRVRQKQHRAVFSRASEMWWSALLAWEEIKNRPITGSAQGKDLKKMKQKQQKYHLSKNHLTNYLSLLGNLNPASRKTYLEHWISHFPTPPGGQLI